MKTKEQILESWFRGNTNTIKRLMRNKSKLYAIDLIPILVGQFGYQYHQAITIVREMCSLY